MLFDPASLDRIAAWLERDVGARYVGSSVLLAWEDGGWFHSAGDRRAGVAFSRDTLVRIYSMTKPIVSLALAQAVERGALHLDAPVSRWLPGWDAMRTIDGEPCATPTLRELALHTSGLTYAFNPGPAAELYAREGMNFEPSGPDDLATTVRRLAALPLAFAPGTAWHYSVGIDVIGHVLEVLHERSLDEILGEDVLGPLGMDDTGFAVPEAKLDRLADCYLFENGTRRILDRGEGSAWSQGRVKRLSGGGGLVSTIDDYARFAAFMNGRSDVRLVSPATLAFMRRNHLGADVGALGAPSFAEMPMRGVGFGLGGAVVRDPGLMGVPGSEGDYGWGGMASTYFWCDPVRGFECVFLTQLVPSSSYPQRAELKALVHGALN